MPDQISRNPSRVLFRQPRTSVVGSRSQKGRDMALSSEEYEEFRAASGTTLPAWLATQDTSAAGTPTLDYVDDVADGEYQLLQDNTDEAQNLTLYSGDQLTIDPSSNVTFEARWKIDMDTAPWSADQRFVIGLAAARNATLDSVTHHAWFRIEGASLNILWETDDSTTDDDDNDTGIDLTDDGYVAVRIELREGQAIFSILQAEVWQVVGAGDMSAATATDLLQVFCEMQKDGGTETEDARIDYIYLHAGRGAVS